MLPVAALIIAVLGSLYAGIATPTEVGAIGAAGAALICLARGRLDLGAVYRIGGETARVTSFILPIVVGAAIFSWVFDLLRLPRAMVDAITGAGLAPWVVMLMIVALYLALGMIIESISMSDQRGDRERDAGPAPGNHADSERGRDRDRAPVESRAGAPRVLLPEEQEDHARRRERGWQDPLRRDRARRTQGVDAAQERGHEQDVADADRRLGNPLRRGEQPPSRA